MKTSIFPALMAVAAAFLLRCVGNTTVSGTGTLIGNPTVAGVLYNSDGSCAAKVTVHIRPKSYLPDRTLLGLAKRAAVIDSTMTDNSGKFAFDTTMDTGTYVIEAAQGANAVFIGPVAIINKRVPIYLLPDTLKPTGAIQGTITLSAGGDPRKVFVLAFGIDRFAFVQADGVFTFTGLAEGSYAFKVISTLDNYGILDTGNFTVTPAETTDIKTLAPPVADGAALKDGATITGSLYNPDGSPATGSPVLIRTKTAPPAIVADLPPVNILARCTTDQSGRFVFFPVGRATYTIEAENLNNAVRIDSVSVGAGTVSINLAPDTLKPKGALKGVIKLRGNPQDNSVYLFLGGPYLFVHGGEPFVFPLAEGRYRIRLLPSNGTYGVFDTTVNIRSGDTTDAGTMELPISNIAMVAPDTLFFDPSPLANPLRLMQTQSGINSFTLNWAAYPQATGYNLYIINNQELPQLITHVQNPIYAKSNIAQRVWCFGEYTPLYRYTAEYVVKPVVSGVEAHDSSRICPYLIDTSTIIHSDYFDAFDYASPSKNYLFSYGGNKYFPQDAGIKDNNQVYMGNGCLHLDINTTDGGPWMGVMLYNDPNKDIRISLRTNAHRANDYVGYNLHFLAYMGYEHNVYNGDQGCYINGTKYSDTEIFDQWTSLSILLKRKENKLVISFDTEQYTIEFDSETIRYNRYLYAGYWLCGWWTGHTLQVDDFRVEYISD